jgi:hypothetical protein
MNTEKALYKYLKQKLPQAHWQRFENAVGTGQPDVNVAYKEREAWLELKCSSNVLLQPSQNAWLHARREQMSNVYVWQYHPIKKLHVLWKPPFKTEEHGKYVKVIGSDHITESTSALVLFNYLFSLPLNSTE